MFSFFLLTTNKHRDSRITNRQQPYKKHPPNKHESNRAKDETTKTPAAYVGVEPNAVGIAVAVDFFASRRFYDEPVFAPRFERTERENVLLTLV